MIEILPESLWIGHAGDGRDHRAQFEVGIRALVQLAFEEPPVQPPREFVYCRFPLLDGAGNDPQLLRLALQTILRLLRSKIPTLLFCSGGMSRSPALAAAAIALRFCRNPEDALRGVTGQHPVDLSPALWREVLDSVVSIRSTS